MQGFIKNSIISFRSIEDFQVEEIRKEYLLNRWNDNQIFLEIKSPTRHNMKQNCQNWGNIFGKLHKFLSIWQGLS